MYSLQTFTKLEIEFNLIKINYKKPTLIKQYAAKYTGLVNFKSSPSHMINEKDNSYGNNICNIKYLAICLMKVVQKLFTDFGK